MTASTLTQLERQLAHGKRLFSPQAVRELCTLVRTLERERDALIIELELNREHFRGPTREGPRLGGDPGPRPRGPHSA